MDAHSVFAVLSVCDNVLAGMVDHNSSWPAKAGFSPGQEQFASLAEELNCPVFLICCHQVPISGEGNTPRLYQSLAYQFFGVAS